VDETHFAGFIPANPCPKVILTAPEQPTGTPPMTRSQPDRDSLRQALGAFATGVTIVTARAPASGEPVGFTANSFTSVSLEPPLLLVCLAHTAASYKVFREADSFAVNVLSAEQQETAMLFATRGADKFGPTGWHPGAMGAPLIEGCLARFDCAMHQRMVAGDHDIIMGRVVGFTRHPGEALVYHGGAFQRLGTKG
jgi:flavin reductase (DIM6/NTAB) family NADH-FMN oxidoreductase RutF